jgi:hypothetical protein
VQSVPITTKVVSSNPARGEVYSIQHNVKKFVSDFWLASGFLWFPPPKDTERHNITEILLEVALNTITPPINNHSITFNILSDIRLKQAKFTNYLSTFQKNENDILKF